MSPIREDWVQYTQGRRLHRGFYDDDSPVWDTLAPPDGSNNG